MDSGGARLSGRWFLAAAVVVAGACGPAQGYYHPGAGRWLQRDPLAERERLNPRLGAALAGQGPAASTAWPRPKTDAAWTRARTETEVVADEIEQLGRAKRTFCLLVPAYHGRGDYLIVCGNRRTIPMRDHGGRGGWTGTDPKAMLSGRPLELYEYGLGRPVGSVDPSGLVSKEACSPAECEAYSGCGECNTDHGIDKWTRTCRYTRSSINGRDICGCYSGGDY